MSAHDPKRNSRLVDKKWKWLPVRTYNDGVLAISRRSAEAVARTAVNHVATQARHLTYEKNKDLLDGWQWVATLEPSTCAECGALDGQVFDVGDDTEEPPAHVQCRCSSAPVVKGGGKADKVTYGSWLADQSEAVQDEALGPTRGKLYREGGLSIDKFVDDRHRPLNLAELRQTETKAFARAGI